jgi:hypothetical protein
MGASLQLLAQYSTDRQPDKHEPGMKYCATTAAGTDIYGDLRSATSAYCGHY